MERESVVSKIIVAAGTRPNFMKIASLMKELEKVKKFRQVLVHTGQHYDFQMSEIFFQELRIPKPDIHLNVGSGLQAVQTAEIMTGFELVVQKEKPALVIVVGDVNSTMACALVASKLGIRIAHVEAGLRSFDRTMPEEINRIVTDQLSDILFVSEASGLKNLKTEGINSKKVFFVGNIMIDTLLLNWRRIERSCIADTLGVGSKNYCVLTLHRPDNVDSAGALLEIYGILRAVASRLKIIYPIHPRARKMMRAYGLLEKFKKIGNLVMVEPLGYLDFIKLVKESRLVLTDSGGIQEETTFLKVPCLTMRENTERPVTLTQGTNVLVGRDKKRILAAVDTIRNDRWKKGTVPELWDGKTASRVVEVLKNG